MFFILGLLMSTALYGIICLLAAVFGLNISFSDLLQASNQAKGFMGLFYNYMVLSPVIYIVLQVVNSILLKVIHLISGDDTTILESLLESFISNLTNPWRGLFTIIGASDSLSGESGLFWLYCWFEVILHFLWSVALLGFIGLGFHNLP